MKAARIHPKFVGAQFYGLLGTTYITYRPADDFFEISGRVTKEELPVMLEMLHTIVTSGHIEGRWPPEEAT